MSLPKREFAGLVRALHGALQWHRRAGDIAFDVPLDFNMPAFDAEAPPLASQAVVDEPIEVLRQAFEKADVQQKAAPGALTRTVVQADVPEKPCWQVIPIDVSVGGSEMAQRAAALQTLKETIGTCTLCPLHAKRSEIVHGHGHPGARDVHRRWTRYDGGRHWTTVRRGCGTLTRANDSSDGAEAQ